MAKVGNLFVQISSSLDKTGFTEASGQVKTLGEFVEKNKGQFAALGKISAAAFAGLSAAAIYSIKKASDLQETTSKFNTVFIGVEKEAKAMSDSLVSSYGTSREESLRFLASIQDLLVPMGLNTKEAANLSGKIVTLSADLGSFNNLGTEEVMRDIQSALVGNFETMKKYGVVLNATAVEQEVLSSGLAKTKDEITQADKATAAYQLIVKGSAAAIGDFSRTQDGFANQMKISIARLADFAAKIGTNLLPAATILVNVFNSEVIPALSDFEINAEKVTGAVKYLIDFVRNGIDIFKVFASALELSTTATFGFVSVLMGDFGSAKVALDEFKQGFVDLMNQVVNLGQHEDDEQKKRRAREQKDRKALVEKDKFELEEAQKKAETELKLKREQDKIEFLRQAELDSRDKIKLDLRKKRLEAFGDYNKQVIREIGELETLTAGTVTNVLKEALKQRIADIIIQKTAELNVAFVVALAKAIFSSTTSFGAFAPQIGAVIAANAAAVAALHAIPSLDQGGIIPGPPGRPVIVQALGGEQFLGRKSIGASFGRGINVTNIITGNTILDDQTAEVLADRVGDKIFDRVKQQIQVVT